MGVPLLTCRIAKQNYLYVLTRLNAPQILKRSEWLGLSCQGWQRESQVYYST